MEKVSPRRASNTLAGSKEEVKQNRPYLLITTLSIVTFSKVSPDSIHPRTGADSPSPKLIHISALVEVPKLVM